MKLAKIIVGCFVALALAFGAGTYYGYHMPRAGVDPQDYIETVFTPYEDGKAAYLAMLDRAQHSVRVAAYAFTEDEIADKLIELATGPRKVDVKVILDLSQYSNPQNTDGQHQVARLRKAGIEVLIGKSPSYGAIMHNKYTVADGIWVYSGSWNFSNSANKQANELDFIKSEKRAKRFLDNWDNLYQFMKYGKKGKK